MSRTTFRSQVWGESADPLLARAASLLAEEFAGAAFGDCFYAFAMILGAEEPGLFLEFVIGLQL